MKGFVFHTLGDYELQESADLNKVLWLPESLRSHPPITTPGLKQSASVDVLGAQTPIDSHKSKYIMEPFCSLSYWKMNIFPTL